MPTTSTLRRSYPELIVSPGPPPRCNYAPAARVAFLAGGAYPSGRVELRVHPAARQAFRALAATLLFHRYSFDETAGGTLSCRTIGGSSNTSLHAHGIALDINPSRNGYAYAVGHLDDPDTAHKEGLLQWGRFTDLPARLVRDVEAIRTAAGSRVFEWGGRWWNVKDPMHFELDILQSQLSSEGINLATVKGWAEYLAFETGSGPTLEDQMLDRNSPRPSVAVADYQADLIALGYDLGTWDPLTPAHPPGADGLWGEDTETATGAFQQAKSLQVTKRGDALTVALVQRTLYAGGGPGDYVTKSELAAHATDRKAHHHQHTIPAIPPHIIPAHTIPATPARQTRGPK